MLIQLIKSYYGYSMVKLKKYNSTIIINWVNLRDVINIFKLIKMQTLNISLKGRMDLHYLQNYRSMLPLNVI